MDRLGPSVIQKGFKIGISSDFWNRFESDIQLAKNLGASAADHTAADRRKELASTMEQQCGSGPLHWQPGSAVTGVRWCGCKWRQGAAAQQRNDWLGARS